MFHSLYADDGAFMFTSREGMITGTSLLHTHLQCFRMLMHVGSYGTETSESSKSKTESVYFFIEIPLLMRSNQILLTLT